MIDLSNKEDERVAEFLQAFVRYSKIHDHVIGLKSLKISIQGLTTLV